MHSDREWNLWPSHVPNQEITTVTFWFMGQCSNKPRNTGQCTHHIVSQWAACACAYTCVCVLLCVCVSHYTTMKYIVMYTHTHIKTYIHTLLRTQSKFYYFLSSRRFAHDVEFCKWSAMIWVTKLPIDQSLAPVSSILLYQLLPCPHPNLLSPFTTATHTPILNLSFTFYYSFWKILDKTHKLLWEKYYLY